MMVMFKLNDEEIALIKAFRQLTGRQRQMILKGVTGVTTANAIKSKATVIQFPGPPPRMRLAG